MIYREIIKRQDQTPKVNTIPQNLYFSHARFGIAKYEYLIEKAVIRYLLLGKEQKIPYHTVPSVYEIHDRFLCIFHGFRVRLRHIDKTVNGVN